MNIVLKFLLILAISISIIGLNSVFAENETQIVSTYKGTLDVRLSYDKIILGQPTTLRIDFVNPQTQQIQEHIDWSLTILKDGQIVWGPTPLSHTSEGSLKNLKYEFEDEGTYHLEIEIEGILFQPIPIEKASFDISVGDTNLEKRLESCSIGDYQDRDTLESWTLNVKEENSGICIIDYFYEHEGGYGKYECKIPTEEIKTTDWPVSSLPFEYDLIKKYCKLVNSGNIFLELAWFLELLKIAIIFIIIGVGILIFFIIRWVRKRRKRKT